MEYTYTVYKEDEPAEEIMKLRKAERINDEIEIVVRVKMDAKKYEERLMKYQEPICKKIAKLFTKVN